MTSTFTQAPVTTESLDVDELLHFAVQDSQRGRHDEAIEKLKRGLALQPDNAKLMFLLGAEHAELGMTDRAIDEMIAAVAIAPGMAIAHFQLGLLYLLHRSDINQARRAWSALDALPDADSLVAFKSGLLHLADDSAVDCVRDLDRGLRLNRTNPSLNLEMAKIRNRIHKTLQEASGAKAATVADASTKLLLDTYKASEDL